MVRFDVTKLNHRGLSSCTQKCAFVISDNEESHLHTKVCKKFGADRVILPQTIINMEKSVGLSPALKQRIIGFKVAVAGSVAVEHIAEAISRLGIVDIELSPDRTHLPVCDVAICTSINKEDCREVLVHYANMGVPVICAFNFGIGACAVIIPPKNELPHFVENKADDNTVTAMIDYTSGYSKFWNIQNNNWIDDAAQWITTPEISSSIGEYTMTAMVAHLLVALIAGNNVKTYPKFYLSTIANDVN